MSGSHVSRAWQVIEALFNFPEGRTLGDLAGQMAQPKASVFRDLREYSALGLVRQDVPSQRYVLTHKLIGMALRHLARTGVHDAAQPVLDRLSRTVGELVRLAVMDGDMPVYVAWSQGRHSSLRYEPVNGDVAPLFCTATGHAFLATLDDERASRLLASQPELAPASFGRNAPRTLGATLRRVRETRTRGYGFVVDSFVEGMTAVAATVANPDEDKLAVGVISIAVPSALCDARRAAKLGAHAVAAAHELADIYKLSKHFRTGAMPSAGAGARRL